MLNNPDPQDVHDQVKAIETPKDELEGSQLSSKRGNEVSVSFSNDLGKSDLNNVEDTFVKKDKAKHKLSRNEQIPKMRSKEYAERYSMIYFISFIDRFKLMLFLK